MVAAPRILPQALRATRSYATQAGAVKPPLMLHGLAGKYATSAFVAAASRDAKTLSQVETDLKQLKSIISPAQKTADSAKARDFLANPVMSHAEKAEGIKKMLGGKEGEITRNLFAVLADNGRLGDTEKVIDGFLQLMSAHRGEIEVTVTSATALDKSTASRLEAAIKGSQYASKGKNVKITQKVNPSIQGGLVVDFGDRSVDLSVSSRVNRLNSLLQQGI